MTPCISEKKTHRLVKIKMFCWDWIKSWHFPLSHYQTVMILMITHFAWGLPTALHRIAHKYFPAWELLLLSSPGHSCIGYNFIENSPESVESLVHYFSVYLLVVDMLEESQREFGLCDCSKHLPSFCDFLMILIKTGRKLQKGNSFFS